MYNSLLFINKHTSMSNSFNSHLFFRNLDLTVVDLFHNVSRVLTVDSATNRAILKINAYSY